MAQQKPSDDECLGEKFFEAAGEAVGGKLGELTATLATSAGKELYRRAITARPSGTGSQRAHEASAIGYIPYAIVGLGRCGSHVTIELAKLAYPDQFRQSGKRGSGFFAKLFAGKVSADVRTPKPMLIVGDIDEFGLEDVSIDQAANSDMQIKMLDYRPLTSGGVGNVPALSEFYTRALLSMRSKPDSSGQWEDAKQHLVQMVRAQRRPRLVFYVASAGGGTGSGAAPEVLRAQRWELAIAEGDAGMFFMGVSVLPELNKKHLDTRRRLNAGRFIVRYLAELAMPAEQSYDTAPNYEYRHRIKLRRAEHVVRPWDCLMLVSNGVVGCWDGAPATIDKAQQNANIYIAQQVFSLAASQLRAEAVPDSDGPEVPSDSAAKQLCKPDVTENVNYRSIRLDPNDLLSALSGVCMVAFAALSSDEVKDVGKFKSGLARLISPPQIGKQSGLVEGISVLPDASDKYSSLCAELKSALAQEGQGADGRGGSSSSYVSALTAISALPAFSRCPRVVFVVNSPSNEPDPSELILRAMEEFLEQLLPAVRDSRFAVVKQAQKELTISVFFEASVVLAPDVVSCIKNYLKLLWKPSLRSQDKEAFTRDWDRLLLKDSDLSTAGIAAWLGDRELYSNEVGNLAHLASGAQGNLQRWVHTSVIPEDVPIANVMSVRECDVGADEVAAAMRLIRYVHNYHPVTMAD